MERITCIWFTSGTLWNSIFAVFGCRQTLSDQALERLDALLLACCGQFMSFQDDVTCREKAKQFRESDVWKQTPDIHIITLLTSILRILRNASIHNPSFQDKANRFHSLAWIPLLFSSNYLLHEAGEAFVEYVWSCSFDLSLCPIDSTDLMNSKCRQLRLMRRVLIQAMTNLAVKHKDNADILWRNSIPVAIMTSLEVANSGASRDKVLCERICTFINTCLSTDEATKKKRLSDLVSLQ